MERLNLYKIRDLALKSGRAVFSIQQLANLIGKPKSIAKVYASRMAKKGLVKRLLRGKISFVEDDFVIAAQLLEPSYISLNSALLFHNIITQVPKAIECVTPRNSRRYGELGIVYHKIPSRLLFGYKKYRKAGSYIFVAEPEKALLDGIYLNAFKKGMVKELMEKMDKKKLSEYAAALKGRGAKKARRMVL